MKIKNISKLLSTTLILSNLNISSLAGILSEDRRYELFEGSNIVVENVLEDGYADVEIEGNTLVNLADGEYGVAGGIINKGQEIENGYTAEVEVGPGSIVITKGVSGLKDNTKYTLVCDVRSTMDYISFSFKNSQGYAQGIISETNNQFKFRDYRVAIVLTTTSGCTDVVIGNHGSDNVVGSSLSVKNLMVLEGDWSNRDIPDYFEGLKSLGESGDIVLNSSNKNLFDLNRWKDIMLSDGSAFNGINYDEGTVTITGVIDDTYIHTGATGNHMLPAFELDYLIEVEPNTSYTVSFLKNGSHSGSNYIQEYNNFYRTIGITGVGNEPNSTNCSLTFITDKDTRYIGFRFGVRGIGNKVIYSNIQIEKSEIKTDYTKHQSSEKNISLIEPLRGLPNGTKDRIIKKNGQWVIERNCAEAIYDGSDDENLVRESQFDSPEGAQFYSKYITEKMKRPSSRTEINIVADKLTSYSTNDIRSKSYKQAIGTDVGYDVVRFIIDKSYLSSVDVEGLRDWLSKNPVRIVYELKNPVYEKVSDVSIKLYPDKTYLTNNSSIPATIKVVIDRAANRAKEAIQEALANPTADTISQARYWTNLMRESSLKDDFQGQINNELDITDMSIEKKKISVNSDIYIKMKNTLSLSLDTNSIVFNDVDSTQDTEIKNAVNLTVSSSLPYVINASLESEMYNKDKSDSLDKSLLNIKSSDSSTYLGFADIKVPIEIVTEQQATESKIHSIDLLLAGDSYKKADVYKSTLKFEVEQK